MLADRSMMTSVTPRLLLLGAHRWRRDDVVQFACAAGFHPVLLVHEHETIPDHLASATREVIRQSTATPLSARDIASRLSKRGPDWFVLALDDYVCQFGAEISQFTSRPTMKPLAAYVMLHKHLLRRRWNELCTNAASLYPVPYRYRQYADAELETISEELQDCRFSESVPLIVKPDALDASIAVRKAENWNLAAVEIDQIREVLRPLAPDAAQLGIEVAPAIIAEHEIPRSKVLHRGAEFSAEFISVTDDNDPHSNHVLLGITQKFISPDSFVEVAHCFPAEDFPRELVGPLKYATAHLLDALDVKRCISHWEFIVTEDGRLALVEAQVRPAGDRIMNLMSIATGVNPYLTLLNNLGRGVMFPPCITAERVAAVFFPMPSREITGRFSITVPEQLIPLINERLFIVDDLANITAWDHQVHWDSRHVSIIGDGGNLCEAKSKCDSLLSNVRVNLHDNRGRNDVTLVLPLI